MTYKHKWNLSWPGNFCLKCHCDDPVEIALADNHYDPDTGKFDTPELEAAFQEALKCPIPDE